MSGITTHVLDLAAGRPGAGISVTLSRRSDRSEWVDMGHAVTDSDGRARTLLDARPGGAPATPLQRGLYRLRFDTGPYFSARNIQPFFPCVEVTFSIDDERQHYHVPLLLSPFGYSTYRGS